MNPLWKRPATLAELANAATSAEEFDALVTDFLHALQLAKRQEQPIAPMLVEEPLRLQDRFAEGRVCDVFLAGLADYLSRKNGLPTPSWSRDEERRLEHPWFPPGTESARAWLLREAPSAFRERGVFTLESSLEVV